MVFLPGCIRSPWLFDILTGPLLDELVDCLLGLQDTAGNVAWASDNKTLFYVTKDKLDRPFKVACCAGVWHTWKAWLAVAVPPPHVLLAKAPFFQSPMPVILHPAKASCIVT